MMHALGWAGAMAAILVMCLWLGTRKARLRRTEQAWLPVELRHARIEFAERYFYTKRPVRLIAKVDRVYKDERGTLFVTELKRRVKTQAYLSDVVELSAQKLAIERGGRRAVAEVGFVVIEHPVTQKRTPIRVRLLREHEIVALATAIRASRRRRRNARQGECRRSMPFVRLRRSLSTGSPQRYLRTDAGCATRGERQRALPLSAAAAPAEPPARRRATVQSPGRRKTMARSSPGSGQSHKS